MRRPGSVGPTPSGVRARALTISAVSTLVVGGVLVLTETAAHAVNEECAPQGAQVVCRYNDATAVADFQVPAGVHSVEAALIGGRGGDGWNNPGTGAPGGNTATTLGVIPGQILGAWVGGAGSTPSGCSAGGVGGRSGGKPTGGNGGAGSANCDDGPGGGGGGGSFITVGLTLTAGTVLAAAGGGGGGGGEQISVNVLPASIAVASDSTDARAVATDDGGAGGGSQSGPQPGDEEGGGTAAGVVGIFGGAGATGGGGGGSGAPRSGTGATEAGEGGGGGCGTPGPCVPVPPEEEEQQDEQLYRATQTSPIEISYIPVPDSRSGPSGHGGPSSNDPNPNTNPGADPKPLPGMDPATATARCKPEKKICSVSVSGPDSRFKIDAENGDDTAILFATMNGNWRPASVEASGKPNCPDYAEQNSDWVQFGFFEPERGKSWHKTGHMTQRQKMKRGAAEALAKKLQVCFAAPYTFPTRPGYRLGTSGPDRVGVLPECGTVRAAKGRPAPCVVTREIIKVKGGWTVRITFKIPANSQDPKALG